MNNKAKKLLALCEAQNHRCAYCGVDLIHRLARTKFKKGFAVQRPPRPAQNWPSYKAWKWYREATLDHVIPKSQGGTNGLHNLVASCRYCNWYRGNHPADYAFTRIQRMLRRKTHPHLVYAIHGRFPQTLTFIPISAAHHAS
mgnify:CR=1 FL=1